jgi:hypothetical protein
VTWRTSLLTVKDVVKDVVLTGIGCVAVWSQIFRASPNPYVIMAGLVLTAPNTAAHVRALLAPGPGDGDSSLSTPPPPPQQPQSLPHSQPGGTGNE